jgi:hypothetical protein
MAINKSVLNHYVIIFIITLLSHGLLLINDGLYWDGWLSKGYLDNGDWESVKQQTFEMGLPVIGYLMWALKVLKIHEYYKLTAFLMIFLSATLIYKIADRLKYTTKFESLLIAVIFVTFPAYQTSIEISTLQYLIFLFLFYLSIFLIVEVKYGDIQRYKYLINFLALVGLFISFNMNSLLVYFYAFILILAIKEININKNLLSEIKKFLIKNLIFILLPFIYFGCRKYLTPPHGLYEGYHSFNLDPIFIISLVIQYIRVSVLGQIFNSLVNLKGCLILLFIGFFCIEIYYRIAVFKFKKGFYSNINVDSWFNTANIRPLAFFSAVCIFTAILPYAVVGLFPAIRGVNTRHSILISLPVALLIISIFRNYSINFNQLDKASRIIFKKTQLIIIWILVLSFIYSCNLYYISWQARAIKDNAVLSILKSKGDIKSHSIYWIDDQYKIGPTAEYSYYEYSSMFKKIWGGESRLGLPLTYYDSNRSILQKGQISMIHRYNLGEFDARGSSLFMTIKPKQNYSEAELVFLYYINRSKSFYKKIDMNNFYDNLLSIEYSLLPPKK